MHIIVEMRCRVRSDVNRAIKAIEALWARAAQIATVACAALGWHRLLVLCSELGRRWERYKRKEAEGRVVQLQTTLQVKELEQQLANLQAQLNTMQAGLQNLLGQQALERKIAHLETALAVAKIQNVREHDTNKFRSREGA